MSKSFITGSQMYGNPGGQSDIDLVIPMDRDQMNLLVHLYNEAGLNKEGEGVPSETVREDSVSLRFGKLNLIVCCEKEVYTLWKEGTDYLRSKAPVSRIEAREHFDILRRRLEEGRQAAEAAKNGS